MADSNWSSIPDPTGLVPVGGEPPQGDDERAPQGTLLVESAWEVCNQVGGIYQVLRSKAPLMVERWRHRYMLVGPYIEARAPLEFEPRRPTGWAERVIDACRAEGVGVHHGRWLVSARPRVMLVEHLLSKERLDQAKHLLWKHHQIESPPNDPMIDGVIGFGYGLLVLLRSLCREWVGADAGRDRRLLAHFHEWMGGAALPLARQEKLPLATVFTTHATLLGRYIASSDETFYDRLGRIDHAAESARFGVKTQHAMERACAASCHTLTTVSGITGEECAALLGRAPDLVLPNGLNVDRYNVGHDFQTFHAQFKERINRFTMGHFFPSYSFDLDKVIYVFTSGRFEPRNKGFDLCLESMARLNAELRALKLGITVVFFIVTSRPTRSLNPRALQARGVLNELREVCGRITRDVGEQLFRRASMGEKVRLDDLIDEYWRLRFRRTQTALKTDQLPLVVTHVLEDDAADPVLAQIRNVRLFNAADDPVKVVYHPEFINPASPLWGIEYEQFVRGCHLGIFPSLYEPWGYTPLECVAMGVPAVTSDLAGFGRHVVEAMPDHESWGLWVLRRRGRGYFDSAADLTRILLHFCRLDRRGRVAMRNEVERRSWEFDWNKLGQAYHWAHDLALARAGAGVQ